MHYAKLIHVVNFMPERIIKNDEFLQQLLQQNPDLIDDDKLVDNPFFKGVEQRHFASPDYTSSDLGYRVGKKLLKQCQINADKIDMIICSCIFTDTYWPGIATDVQHRLGASNASILNIDTSCCSFLSSLTMGEAFIQSGKCQNVMVITATNFISRLEEFQKSPRSFVLGDGATAALLCADNKQNSIISNHEKCYGENYGLMRFEPDVVDGIFNNYWQRGCGAITVNFDKPSLDQIRDNALRIVPEVIDQCLLKAGLTKEEINCLITHQPNQFFIDNWRQAIGISIERCHDTLAKYGNLFQSSVSVTLADGLENNIIKTGDTVAIATFSNGGDYGSAMILKM